MRGPSVETQIYDFVKRNALDQEALGSLMQLTPDVAKAIMDEGPVTGRNPSKVLLGRIRRFQDRMGTVRYPEPSHSHTGHGHGHVAAASHPQSYPSRPATTTYAAVHAQQPPPHQRGPPAPPAPSIAAAAAAAASRGYGSFAAPPPVNHHRSESPVAKFVQANGLDTSGEQILREQPRSVQLRCVEEGWLSGRNFNAVLKSRIKRTIEAMITEFVQANYLDREAEEALREAPREMAASVIDEGPITGKSKNTGGILMSRLRRLGFQPQARGAATLPPSSAATYTPPPPVPPAHQSPLDKFIAYNRLNPEASDFLRSQPEDLQNQLMAQGDITSHDALKELQNRIADSLRAQDLEEEEEYEQPGGADVEVDEWQAKLEHFASANSLDQECIDTFYGQERWIQEALLDAPPSATRITNKVLLMRIQRIIKAEEVRQAEIAEEEALREAEEEEARDNAQQLAENWAYGEPPGGQEPEGQKTRSGNRSPSPCTLFIQDNNLDDECLKLLKAQTPDVQQEVMKEGRVSGRNPNKVFTSRVRRFLRR
mmetsp:Transcript_90018/g.188207  ORF Transcript_90018/g.188207 Transcript_90018/m.188207 type:complete len:541 (+) Transcript_90018:87-1709(+)